MKEPTEKGFGCELRHFRNCSHPLWPESDPDKSMQTTQWFLQNLCPPCAASTHASSTMTITAFPDMLFYALCD